MPNHLTYPLSSSDGYFHNWLVLGPCDLGIEARPTSTDQSKPDFSSPCELDEYSCGDQVLYWEVAHCGEDHLIDRSDTLAAHTWRRLWAFTRLACRKAQDTTLHLTTTCPAALWLNGAHIGDIDRPASSCDQTPSTYSFDASLRAGDNDILVRLEQGVVGDAATAFALRLDSTVAAEVRVRVPTVTGIPKERIALERAFAAAYLDRAVYAREDTVRLICHDEMDGGDEAVLRLQKPDGRIYVETFAPVEAGAVVNSILGMQLPPGPMQAVLMPPPGRFYNEKFRARRIMPFWVATRPYALEPSGSADERLVELMQEAARGDDPLYAEVAKMALGWWTQVKPGAIQGTLERIGRVEIGCLPDLLGVLGMRRRMSGYAQFPSALLPAIDARLLDFDYTGRTNDHLAFSLEHNQILLYACRVLAGQTFQQAAFAASGLVGRAERSAGEKLALAWLQRHAQAGFSRWDAHLDPIVTALAHLADLAENMTIREMSAVLLDKLTFGLALHSFKGTFGSTRGYARTVDVRSGRLSAESALNRLLWGLGCYSYALKGAVSLGLARGSYELPEIIARIAHDREPAMWALERNLIAHRSEWTEVNKATYKTPDYLLSAAQDWRPGQCGQREQVWQATMGPDALVYTNYPTCCSQSDSRHAAWWCGNGALPRVAQWKDALIALYCPLDAAQDRLDFTHAHFPCAVFDEHVLREGWAFARCGGAYIALYASQGLELIERGADAYRELRSLGTPVVWLCQMGRAELDGDLGGFQQRVLSTAPRVDGLRVEWETIRGEHLTFDWTAPLLVDDREQPTSGFKHFDGPYALAEMPATYMDIRYGEDVMRLDFA
jgi:hypothetical protein